MKLDLSVGNPGFLQDIYTPTHFHPPMVDKYRYDTKIKGFLEGAIRKLHKQVGNIADVDSYEVVVANGATQLLDALIPAHNYLEMYAPYWSRFKGIADARKVSFYGRTNPESFNFTVYPNNPDFLLPYYNYYTNVVDACYHWPMYYRHSEFKALTGEVFLFSLAKLSGLAASRVGWALVRNPEKAKQLRDYVELVTSGVSVDGQVMAYNGISHYGQYYLKAKSILNERWLELESLNIKPNNSEGMFALYNDAGHSFESSDIIGLRGSAMGVSDDIIRLNIGCSNEEFKELTYRLGRL